MKNNSYIGKLLESLKRRRTTPKELVMDQEGQDHDLARVLQMRAMLLDAALMDSQVIARLGMYDHEDELHF